MTSNSPFGVIFDMDGVLIDSAPLHFESWRQLAGELGRHVSESDFRVTFGMRNQDIVPILFAVHESERVRNLGNRKEEIFRGLLRKQPPIVSGAVELITDLNLAGVPTAVGSSAPAANIRIVLTAMGVAEMIHAVVNGDDVQRGKPDPQVFLEACRRLSFDPKQCVVVEDAVSGIEAARRAGTCSVGVAIYHPISVLSGADLVVSRLSDLTVARLRSLVDESGHHAPGPGKCLPGASGTSTRICETGGHRVE